jgi:hypothetical protein
VTFYQRVFSAHRSFEVPLADLEVGFHLFNVLLS